jgi:hypothetical protein
MECRNCTTYDNLLYNMWANRKVFEKLEPAKCLNEYATSFQSRRLNLFVVVNGGPDDERTLNRTSYSGLPNNTHLYDYHKFDASNALHPWQPDFQYAWVCTGLPEYMNSTKGVPCSQLQNELKSAQDQWNVGCIYRGKHIQWPVHYCLSEKATPQCRLEYNRGIIVIVTLLNLRKCSIYLPLCLVEIRSCFYTSMYKEAAGTLGFRAINCILKSLTSSSEGRAYVLRHVFHEREPVYDNWRRDCVLP